MRGWLKIDRVGRNERGQLVMTVRLRTWHPSWWVLLWTRCVAVVSEVQQEEGGHPALWFPIALYLWASMMVATVRLPKLG